MFLIALQITVIAVLASFAALIPGTFLVLRRMALMSDAISHAVLPGIVLTFLMVRRLDSPWLMLGATCAGVCTVLLVEALVGSTRVKQDAAVGLVYPVFFSLGVILVSCFARNVHLDTDMVLLGDIAFAPLHHVYAWGIDWGPRALWSVGALLIANAAFVLFFYKELVLACFDWDFARSSGSKPRHLHYALMISASATAVVLFDIVGSIMVVALMIIPAATALIRARDMRSLMLHGSMYSALAALSGYCISFVLDISIAGSIATVAGVILIGILFGDRKEGVLSFVALYKQRVPPLVIDLVCMHLARCGEYGDTMEQIAYAYGWKKEYVQRIVEIMRCSKLINQSGDRRISINQKGIERIRSARLIV